MRKSHVYLGMTTVFITAMNVTLAGQQPYYGQPGMQPSMQPMYSQDPRMQQMQQQPMQPMYPQGPQMQQQPMQQGMPMYSQDPRMQQMQQRERYIEQIEQQQRAMFFNKNLQANNQNWEFYWNNFKKMNNLG